MSEVGEHLPYLQTPDGIMWKKLTRDGSTSVRLTNFQCRIVAEVTRDDGITERRVFELEAILEGRHIHFSVTAAQFSGMNWATEYLGAKAIIFPGFGLHEHARVAIQTLSSKIDCRRVYEHTGWRNLDGSWAYLHGGGAITEQGVDLTAEVNLPDSLKPFALPAPPEGDDLVRAVRASLRMLDVAPDEVIFPSLAAVYRAPLGACDFTLHLAGSSGVGKSALAALAQQHFGAGFDINRLPGSWLSTANALAHLTFTCKDALLVVDDFAPTGNQGDVERFHRDADRLLRGQGNGASRARLRSDGSLRPTTPPRGLILSTGEDVPRGQSLRARMLIVQVTSSDLRWDLLTPCQDDASAGDYAKAMAAYLRWLAPQYNDLVNGLRTRLNELRSRAAAASFHRRTPEIVANLALGLDQFTIFASPSKPVGPDNRCKRCNR